MKRHPESTRLIPIISLILAMVVVLVGCGVLGPKPEIVGREAYDTVVEGDYSVVVTVDIVNQGRSGNVEVIGEVWWQGSYWKESKVVYIREGAEREVYLVFKGPSFLGSVFGVLTGQPGFKYRVDVNP